jgi:YVTN family beta-propeller protein
VNDFERRLSDALRTSADQYRPSDPYEAKQRFLKRFRRRRAIFLGGSVIVAGAAAAVAFLVVPQQMNERAQPLPPATRPTQLSIINVGENPSGIAFGNDQVWAANTTEGTVSVIDPLTNFTMETYEVGGAPEDVAVGLGAAWVSDRGAGTITKLAFESGSEPRVLAVGAVGRRLDVAPGVGAVWVVSEDFGVFRIDPETDEPLEIEDDLLAAPTDVAAGQGSVFVLGESSLLRIDPRSLAVTEFAQVDPSQNQDLQLSEGAVWVADGDAGEVTRFDIETGEASDPIFVGGTFTAIASGEGSMWMISGNEGDDGNLTRIDPDSAEIIGERVSLGGRPYDVTTGADSVWVVNYATGSVSRLDPNALPAVSPTGG